MDVLKINALDDHHMGPGRSRSLRMYLKQHFPRARKGSIIQFDGETKHCLVKHTPLCKLGFPKEFFLIIAR